MPQSKFTYAERKALRAKVARILKRHGQNYDWAEFGRKHGVGHATLGRWRKELYDSGIATQVRLREERKKRRAQNAAETGKHRELAQSASAEMRALAAALPQVPVGPGALGVDVAVLAQRLESCATDADQLIAYAQRDGQIRNPRIFHQGVELKRRVAETVPRVLSFLWDVHQAERTIRIMFDVIAEGDPQTAHRIVERLRAANRAMGLFL